MKNGRSMQNADEFLGTFGIFMLSILNG